MKATTYDYKNQVWIVDGKYVKCGHPSSMNCKCYGKLHAGEKVKLIDVGALAPQFEQETI